MSYPVRAPAGMPGHMPRASFMPAGMVPVPVSTIHRLKIQICPYLPCQNIFS